MIPKPIATALYILLHGPCWMCRSDVCSTNSRHYDIRTWLEPGFQFRNKNHVYFVILPRSKQESREKIQIAIDFIYSWPDLMNQYSIYIIIYMGPYTIHFSMLHRSIEHSPKPYRPNRQVARALGPLKQSNKPSSALFRTDGDYLHIARSGKPKTHPDLSGMNTDRSMSACCSS